MKPTPIPKVSGKTSVPMAVFCLPFHSDDMFHSPMLIPACVSMPKACTKFIETRLRMQATIHISNQALTLQLKANGR